MSGGESSINNQLEWEITIPSILRFTFSSTIMMVIMFLHMVVDGTLVSRLVRTDAFSAANIVYPLSSVTIGLGTMFGTGMTTLVSRKLGEGKWKEANRIFSPITVCTVILRLAVSAVSLLFLKSLTYAMGSSEEILGYCYDYVMPLVFFFVPNILQLMSQSLYAADGKPQIGLAVMIVGGLANVALDYLFIAVFYTGIAGVAVVTGIGHSLPALYGLWYFARNRHGNFCFMKSKKHFRALVEAAGNSSSEMVNLLSTSIITFLFNIIMMRLVGQNGVAAISILLYLDLVLIAISLDYSMGVALFISYNYRGGNSAKFRNLFRMSVGLCTVISIFMTVGTLLSADYLSAISTRRGTEVHEMAVAGLRIYVVGYLLKGYNIYAPAMFTAYGDDRTSAMLSFLRTLVFLVVSLIGLAAPFGVTGVWFASSTVEMLALGLSVCYTVKYRKWLHLCKDGGRVAA